MGEVEEGLERHTQSCSFCCAGTPISSNVLGPLPIGFGGAAWLCGFGVVDCDGGSGGDGIGLWMRGGGCCCGGGKPGDCEGGCCCICCGAGKPGEWGGWYPPPNGDGEVGSPFPPGPLSGLNGPWPGPGDGLRSGRCWGAPICCGPGERGGRGPGEFGGLGPGASKPMSTGGGRCWG